MDTFDQMMATEFPDGITPNDADIRLSTTQRATYYGLEAMLYALHSLHAEAEVVALTEGEVPIEMVMAYDVVSYLRSTNGSFMGVLDQLTAWEEDRLLIRLGYGFVAWMKAHNLADHIHVIVQLPVLGFLPLRLQQEEPVMILPIPREAMED